MNIAELLGVTPESHVLPQSADEVEATLVEAAAAKYAIFPWGGGTGQTYGYLPDRARGVLLDLSRMNRVLAHEPGDLTVTVEAGATLDAVQDVLAQHNQFLPLDPPHSRVATLGGILATDAHGPSRVGYGRARDWLIGLTVVDARGRLVKGGGKVVKNVTGYDLPKLHIGALGTLGVIVEATFKVAPRPEASQPLMFALPEGDAETAQTFVTRIFERTTPSFGLIRDENGARLAVFLYNGHPLVVEDESVRAVETAAALGLSPLTTLPPGTGSPFSGPPTDCDLIVRGKGLPQDEVARHDALAQRGCWSRVDTLPSLGQTDLYLRPGEDPEAALRWVIQWAQNHHVSFTVLHAPLALRRSGYFPLWWPSPSSLPLMRSLKAALDPDSLLNPGRFLEGI